MRILGATVGVLLASALLFITACSAGKSKSDAVSISIDGRACMYCVDHVEIRRNGALSFVASGIPDVSDVTISNRAFAQLPLDELTHPAPSDIESNETTVDVWVGFSNGSSDHAVVPVDPNLIFSGSPLQRWIESTSFDATNRALGARRKAIYDAIRERNLRAIKLNMLGCYGSCPGYAVTFAANGLATIHDRGPGCDVRAAARVPFGPIIDAARSASAQLLRPRYPIRAVDTQGARIRIDTPRGIFTSFAPDSMTWGLEFVALQSRLDQMVRTIRWQPPVDIDACAKSIFRAPASLPSR